MGVDIGMDPEAWWSVAHHLLEFKPAYVGTYQDGHESGPEDCMERDYCLGVTYGEKVYERRCVVSVPLHIQSDFVDRCTQLLTGVEVSLVVDAPSTKRCQSIGHLVPAARRIAWILCTFRDR